MENYVFATYKTPRCIWDGDLSSRNRRFLEMMDPGYFEFQAKIFGEAIEAKGDDRLAAISLRNAYFHGLESFFSFLCAFLQAPLAIPAWLLKYNNRELRQLVGDLNQGVLPFPGMNIERPTWKSISSVVHNVKAEEAIKVTVVEGFARTWKGFADDFLSEEHRSEYNSIKHGFRVRPGGVSVAIRREESPGVVDPNAKWMSLGGGLHGTEYLKVEMSSKNRSNFRLRNQCKNWSPVNMVFGLNMISASIRNIIARALVSNGVEGDKCMFVIPEDASWYASPWRERVNLGGFHMDQAFKMDSLEPVSNEDIVLRLNERNV